MGDTPSAPLHICTYLYWPCRCDSIACYIAIEKFSAGLVLVLNLFFSFCYLQGEKTVVIQWRIWNSAFIYWIFLFYQVMAKPLFLPLISCAGVAPAVLVLWGSGKQNGQSSLFPWAEGGSFWPHFSQVHGADPPPQGPGAVIPLPCRSSEVRRSQPAFPGPHRLGSDRCMSHPLPGSC